MTVDAKRRGELVLVATPIGNMGDLSPRAREELSRCDLVCCEDTRRTGRLFQLAAIAPPALFSLHAHNEASRTGEVVARIEAGGRVCLVSDAGMPGISDPGARLVAAVHGAGLRVSCVPGPSAAPLALSLSGFGGGRWRFEGFIEKKRSARRERLFEIADSDVPVVVFEAPGRVEALVSDLVKACGEDRLVCVCRELTKLHEEVWRGPLGEAVGRWGEAAKGEFTLVVDSARDSGRDELSPEELRAAVFELTGAGLSRRDAVREVASRHGTSTRAVYDAVSSSLSP